MWVVLGGLGGPGGGEGRRVDLFHSYFPTSKKAWVMFKTESYFFLSHGSVHGFGALHSVLVSCL